MRREVEKYSTSESKTIKDSVLESSFIRVEQQKALTSYIDAHDVGITFLLLSQGTNPDTLCQSRKLAKPHLFPERY